MSKNTVVQFGLTKNSSPFCSDNVPVNWFKTVLFQLNESVEAVLLKMERISLEDMPGYTFLLLKAR